MEGITSDSESSNIGDDNPVMECKHCNEQIVLSSNENGSRQLSHHLKHVCETSPFYGNSNVKESEASFDSSTCNQDKCRNALARMCIIDNKPFSIVEYQGFKKFMLYANPMFIVPDKLDVARDCLLIYKEEKNKLKEILKDQTVSISIDVWTSVEDYSYLCLTAYWIDDDDWVLRKKILNFCQVSELDGVAIGKMVYGCLREWGIERVFTVAVDDTLCDDEAIGYLKTMLKGPDAFLDCKYLHLKSCAQIINLVVGDELEEKFESVSKIRNAVRYVCSSPLGYASFKESAESLKIDFEKTPCLDVETRWHSTYFMLEKAEKYAVVFERLQSIDNSYRSYFDGGDEDDDDEGSTRKRKRGDMVVGSPQNEDWENARYLIEYLKIFSDVTKKVSGSRYTTANLSFKEFLAMHTIISKMCLEADEKKKNMFLSMKEAYDKYWDNLDNINFVMHVAIVLDPRYKFHYLEFCLGHIYGKDSPKSKEVLDRVTKTLNELFNHYKMKANKEKSQNTTVSSSSSSNDMFDFEAGYAEYLENIGYNLQTELEIYLTDSREKLDDSFEVLRWWKRNSSKFPILSQMARHVFGMPIAFSTGGRVIDEYRSSLPPRTTEALVCAQNWIRSTPVDTEDQDMSIDDLHEIQEKLENTEIDDFSMDGSDEDGSDEDESDEDASGEDESGEDGSDEDDDGN